MNIIRFLYINRIRQIPRTKISLYVKAISKTQLKITDKPGNKLYFESNCFIIEYLLTNY